MSITFLMAQESEGVKKTTFEYLFKEIKLAKSVGVWQKGEDSGFFTALIYRQGLEHGAEKTRVLVKKVQTASDGTSSLEIIKTIDIDTPDIMGTVDDLHLQVIHNKLFLGLDIQMRGMAGAILRKSFLVDSNGTVSLIQNAAYNDTIHD